MTQADRDDSPSRAEARPDAKKKKKMKVLAGYTAVYLRVATVVSQ